jgi:hypothetical protein
MGLRALVTHQRVERKEGGPTQASQVPTPRILRVFHDVQLPRLGIIVRRGDGVFSWAMQAQNLQCQCQRQFCLTTIVPIPAAQR